MAKSSSTVEAPSRREMTIGMSVLLIVGGFAVTRGGDDLRGDERGVIHLSSVADEPAAARDEPHAIEPRSEDTAMAASPWRSFLPRSR